MLWKLLVFFDKFYEKKTCVSDDFMDCVSLSSMTNDKERLFSRESFEIQTLFQFQKESTKKLRQIRMNLF